MNEIATLQGVTAEVKITITTIINVTIEDQAMMVGMIKITTENLVLTMATNVDHHITIMTVTEVTDAEVNICEIVSYGMFCV